MKSICRSKMVARRRTQEQTIKSSSLPASLTKRKQSEGLPVCLAAAIELGTEAVVVTDSRGYIQYVNAAFERMTGYTREEAAGRSLHILDSGRHDEAFFESFKKTLACDGIWKGRLINRKKDGTLYHEECTHTLVKSPSGEITHHLSVGLDVTERLRLESITEEIDTMKNNGYILSGICHEIGNAVNSLAVILSVMKAKLARLDTAALGRYIESAADEAQKAAYIIRSLRNYNVHAKPEIRQVELSEFVGKIITLVKDDFSEKGIEIDVSIDEDVERCCTDPRALHQVMLNLLINASDALEGRAQPRVFIRISKSGEHVRVRVEDNGCGMSDDQLRNLFKPFHTTKAHGTGLGLVIVRKLLTAMHGSLQVTSSKDAGTAMDIILPGERVLAGTMSGAASDAAAMAGQPDVY